MSGGAILSDSEAVDLTLRGCRVTGKPTVYQKGEAQVETALHDLLVASPRDASHAGVGFDAEGQPIAADVADSSKGLVLISIEVFPLMKAISYKVAPAGNDKPEIRLVDLPPPTPGPDEVLVRVHYAGLSNLDQENSGGKSNSAMTKALRKSPVISGIEMAGVAENTGQGIKKGDRVFGYTHIWKGPFFHAEYVALPEHNLAVVPDGISLKGAASLVGGALTSINALERIAKLSSNDRVFITGATGSVGATAVQLAAHIGAKVSAVCHSSQLDYVVEQGAAEAYGYDCSELPEANGQFDVVFDTAPSLSFVKSRSMLTSRGRYISTLPNKDIAGFFLSLLSRRKWGFLLEYNTDENRMERLRKLIEEGAFIPAIDSIFTLEEAAQAFNRQHLPGKRGKILVDFRQLPLDKDL